jgi:hypothetical protein
MTRKNNEKKSNASRKLIPAIGMLTASAMMLSSATYAWFTMSREVEVQNIRMTATVPEDLQISLGEITNGSNSNNLGDSTSFLAMDGTAVKAPTDCDDDDPFDWSNTADISKYYQFGKLIPASSTTGASVFYTADAANVGKTLKTGATANATTDSATAHAFTAQNADGWYAGTGDYASSGAYTTASAHDTTNDDGYYIDIPVWLRTSSTTSPSVYVTGYVKKGTGTTDEDTDNLYKAVRVAVLNSSGQAAGGVLDLNDGNAYAIAQSGINTIIDSDIADGNFTITKGQGASGYSALTTAGAMSASSYGDVVVNKGATSIGTLTAKTSSTTSQYAAGTKFIIRVWLEGDDVNCWNANAGQDWDISLKFMTSELPATPPSGNG